MPSPSKSSAPDFVGLGHEIARLRQAKGWSIDALAEAAGVGRRTVMNIEQAAKVPRTDTLFVLARALGVELADLVQVL